MTSMAVPSLAGSDQVRHNQQQSQDSGAYLDWNPEDATPASTDFVTVVAIAGDTSPPKAHVTATSSSTPFVTVLSIGTPPQEAPRRLADGSEEVPVYRLPGERLGFGLKFEGGAADVVRRLFIQSCAPDSPASRVTCSWGRLRESDEILQIDGVPVAAMTKVQCVQRMKESKVVMRLVVRKAESPFVIGEVKKTSAPPPIPPRKGKLRQENHAPPPPPDGFADDRRPPEPEVYTDILALETSYRRRDSESDDTGSSLSTVVERSVPTSTSSSGVSIDLARVLGPFEQLEREFGVPQLMPSSGSVLQPPPNFQDAPLSSVEEVVNITLPLSNNDPDDADDDEEDERPVAAATSNRGRGKKRPPPPPPPSPRARPAPPSVPPPVPAPRSPSHLPRLIDFVPKESVTSQEVPDPQPTTKVPNPEEDAGETMEDPPAPAEVRDEGDDEVMMQLPDDVNSPDDDVDQIDGSLRLSCSSPLPTIGEDEEETVDSERPGSTSNGVVIHETGAPVGETIAASDHNNNVVQERTAATAATAGDDANDPDTTTSPTLDDDPSTSDKSVQLPEAQEEHQEAVTPTASLPKDGSLSSEAVALGVEASKSTNPMPVPWPPAFATPSSDAAYPCVTTGMDREHRSSDDVLSPTPPSVTMPPSYSRLPPDGDEFPPRYQDTDSNEASTRSSQPAAFDEVFKNIDRPPLNAVPSPTTRNGGPVWRKDERSERSVRDKIAMFTSGVTSAPPPQLPPPATSPALKAPLTRTTSLTSPPPRSPDSSSHDDDSRRASLHALVEQRRKSISKLRGLVIPEAKAAPTICDLPVIPCDTPPVPPPVVPLTTVPSQVEPTPSLLSSAPWRAPSNLPKYSPAFKRKSLTIRNSDATPRRISVDIPDAPKMLLSEDSDNDSAVSSSRSSISPPSSPLPAASSADSNRRVLKPQSVDAINRKNVLYSARCRSGRDVKAGSPLIRRKVGDEDGNSESSLVETRAPATLRRDPREEIRELERMVNSLEAVLDRDLSFSPSDEALSPSPERIHFRPATLQDLPSNDVKVAFFSDLDLIESPRSGSPSATPNPSSDSTPVTQGVKQRTSSFPLILDRAIPPGIANRPSLPVLGTTKTAVSVHDIRKAFEKSDVSNDKSAFIGTSVTSNGGSAHIRMSSMDSTTSDDGSLGPRHREQYGSISSLASTTSLISQQELQQMIDEANQTLEESNSNIPAASHEVLVVILHRDSAGGSVGITLAGGADYEAKEITVHKVLAGSPAERDGRLQKGDRILSINGRNIKGVTHRESLAILKAPRPEVVLVISRSRNSSSRPSLEDAALSNMRNSRPPRIPEQSLPANAVSFGGKGPPQDVVLTKDGAGLGFSLEGGKDSPLGDRPLTIKKIFTGGSAEKSGHLLAGDELLSVNDIDVTQISRIEAWGLMKRLKNGPVTLKVRRAAITSS